MWPLSRSKKKADIDDKKVNDIQWITVKGRHIPIKPGQSKDDAVKQFLKDDDKEPKKDTPKDEPKKYNNTKLISSANRELENDIIDDVEKVGIEWEDNGEKLVSGFSRNTDPNSSFSNIKGAWDDEVKKHPELKDIRDRMDKHVDDVNQSLNDEFKKSSSLWRGTSPKEIDRLLDKGVVEPYQYNFISYTLDKETGMGFGKNTSGVTVEYDKNMIMNQDIADVKPVKYTAYSNYAGVGEDKDREYPIGFSDEMEVRSNWFKGDKSIIKSLTLHKSKFDDEEFKQLEKKYKETGINIIVKESICPDCGESVDLSGPQATAQIKKKKRHFEFVETTNDVWKEVAEARFKAFTHSSSFVGNVKYDQDNQTMEIILNGKKYDFCNVSERLYDAFEGADSKGAFFNREIKSLHDC